MTEGPSLPGRPLVEIGVMRHSRYTCKGTKSGASQWRETRMGIHTAVGHIIDIEPAFGVVAVTVRCDEGVCETVDFVMNQEEWLAFVAKGCEAMLKGGR